MNNFRVCWCEENGEVQFGSWTNKVSAGMEAMGKRLNGWVSWVEDEKSNRVS